MSILEAVFDSIRRDRHAKLVGPMERYVEIVSDIASKVSAGDDPTPPNDFAEVIDALGKTERAVAEDVETHRKRAEHLHRRKIAIRAGEESRRLRGEYERRNEAFEKLLAEHRAATDPIWERIQALEAQSSAQVVAERFLLDNPGDSATADRLEQLKAKRKKLAEQQRELAVHLDPSASGSYAADLKFAERDIEMFKTKRKAALAADNKSSAERFAELLADAKAVAARCKEIIERKRAMLEPIDKQIRELDAERDQINQRLLEQ